MGECEYMINDDCRDICTYCEKSSNKPKIWCTICGKKLKIADDKKDWKVLTQYQSMIEPDGSISEYCDRRYYCSGCFNISNANTTIDNIELEEK